MTVSQEERESLSLARCREIIGPTAMTDEEVLAMRDTLYELAAVVVANYEGRRAGVEFRPAA